MKKILGLTAAFALLLGSSALAADVVVYNDQAPVAPDAIFSWTGGYIGVNAGGGFGTFDHPFSVSGQPETSADAIMAAPLVEILNGSLGVTAGGFVGGAQAGYNWQSGQFIYGVEADIQASTVKAEGKLDINVPRGSINGEAGTKVDWFGTLRARLGYAATERFMIYGTGGLAYGHVESYINASQTPTGGATTAFVDESVGKTKTGWTIGAGAEYAITDHLTLKSEYLYTDLGKTTLYDGDFLGDTSAVLKNDVAFHTVRVGLNYKF